MYSEERLLDEEAYDARARARKRRYRMEDAEAKDIHRGLTSWRRGRATTRVINTRRNRLRAALEIIGLCLALLLIFYAPAVQKYIASLGLGAPAISKTPIAGLDNFEMDLATRLRRNLDFSTHHAVEDYSMLMLNGEYEDPRTGLTTICHIYQDKTGHQVYCVKLMVGGRNTAYVPREPLNNAACQLFLDAMLALPCFTPEERQWGSGKLPSIVCQSDTSGKSEQVRLSKVLLVVSGSPRMRNFTIFPLP